MMSSTELFSGFLKIAEEVETVKIKKTKGRTGRKKGVKYGAVWQNNYRKRVENDKKVKNLHHKLLKYDKDLHRSLKAMVKQQWIKDLGVDTMNDMFIFAVTEGFINEGFKKDNDD